MANLVLDVVYADVPGFPAGSAVASIVASITGALAADTQVSQTVPVGTAQVSFADVSPDTYTYSVEAVDASGAVLGTAVTGSFEITAPATVTLSLPSAVAPSQS